MIPDAMAAAWDTLTTFEKVWFTMVFGCAFSAGVTTSTPSPAFRERPTLPRSLNASEGGGR